LILSVSQIWPILDRELKYGTNQNVSKFINSNASQDFLDFTATNYDICNLAIVVIFSINHHLGDIWFFAGDICKIHFGAPLPYIVCP